MEAWKSAIVPIRVLAMNSSESISKEALRLIDTCIFPIMNSGEYDAFLVSRHLAALCLMIVTASRENETDRPMFEPGYILSSACHAHHESSPISSILSQSYCCESSSQVLYVFIDEGNGIAVSL